MNIYNNNNNNAHLLLCVDITRLVGRYGTIRYAVRRPNATNHGRAEEEEEEEEEER